MEVISILAASANGQGKAGNITIDARDVSFENKAKVYTDVNQLPFSDATQVKGDGGNIKITSESLSLTNGSQLISNTQGEGNAGNITIDTGSLSVTNESFLASSANGQGNAGNININARDRVLFNKGSAFSNVEVCSLIAVGCTPSNNTIKGNGGNITIKAPSLQLMNDSFLATGVGNDLFGKNVEGNAGNISIHLRDDLYLDQSFITTRLFANGKGKAGDIDIRAGSVFSDQSLISASTQGQGNAGGVSLQATGAISLVDSEISTAIQKGATGDAQGINVTARSLFLSDGAQATINMKSRDLVMRHGSNIRTDAAGENVIGGNIKIDTDFLIALENSDISANSANFRGGNVRINASGIFGTQFRDLASARTSDITATGASADLGGTVELNIPDIEPNIDLNNLPLVPVDTDEVAQACTSSGSQEKSEFVVTGRGGLPDNPSQSLGSDAVDVDLVTLNPQGSQPITTVSNRPTALTPTPIVEANAIAIAENGEVILTANAPTVTPHSSWQKTANCQQLN